MFLWLTTLSRHKNFTHLVFAGKQPAAHLAGIALWITHTHVHTSYVSVQVTTHDEGSPTVITGILESVVHFAHVVSLEELDGINTYSCDVCYGNLECKSLYFLTVIKDDQKVTG